ncbi:hypothetical protein H072_8166 [Dactylellina haptotyla CBS 200.50]|uniref:Glycoside hydrolase family 2 domain-containing protein n=1 Tax=Dactylellina haptotyla (strain CBS 200.50) TaxID=1284197 RepID=S8AAI2_DACHA|nr:hypothetical protein H072_8166 [Dactylellina haptotyla CBS 200.50]
MLQGSETASTLSTRGTYIFPVADAISAPVNDTSGGDSIGQKVSAYELYNSNFGSSPDKMFYHQDLNPYVAGEYVWTGFDYIGEPTPYYSARSSYCGIIDLAGFKKDRFWLYQARKYGGECEQFNFVFRIRAGEVVATDNGDPADMTAFPSKIRAAYSGLALCIVKAATGASGRFTVTASAGGLENGKVSVRLGST